MIERPLLLLGLLAALVPLWLHLRGRREARVVAFSALRFLLDRDPRRARAMRLRERALIGLRMAAAAIASVALAGPLLPSCEPAPADLGDEALTLAVVIDDSLSMTAAPAGQPSAFARARARALALIAALPPGSSAAVVTSAKPARSLHERAVFDLRSVAAELRALEPRASGDDSERALTLAGRLVADAANARVVVLSDLAASGWAGVEGRGVAGVRVDVERVDLGRDDSGRNVGERRGGGERVTARLENTAVLDARATPTPERGTGEVHLAVEVGHVGARPYAGHLVVRVGEREVRRRLELRPGERREVELNVAALRDVAEVSITGSDDLDADDTRLVRLAGDAALRVGVVNGAPRPVPREDEVFFLRRALEVGAAGPGEVEVDVVAAVDLDDARLARYDVLVLANVPELPASALAALVRRLEAGLGVVVSVGDESASSAQLGWLAGLLPDWLDRPMAGPAHRGVRVNERDARVVARARALAERLVPVASGFEELRVSRRLGLRPRADVDRHVALRFADGAPALLAFERGAGTLLLWTTSIDADWTDAPLQPAFVPLVSAMARGAANLGVERQRGALEPGVAFELGRHKRAVALTIEDADGASVAVDVHAAASGRRWRIAGLPAPGRYTAVERDGAGAAERTLLVVVPPRDESGAERLVAKALGRDAAAAGALGEGEGDSPADADDATTAPVPVAPLALLLLLLLLITEGALVAHRSEGWRALRGRLGALAGRAP